MANLQRGRPHEVDQSGILKLLLHSVDPPSSNKATRQTDPRDLADRIFVSLNGQELSPKMIKKAR